MNLRRALLISAVIVGIMIISAIAYTLTTSTDNTVKKIVLPYYAKLSYVVTIEKSKSLTLPPGKEFTIEIPPLPPSNYRFDYMIISIENPVMTLNVRSASEIYLEKSRMGAIEKIYAKDKVVVTNIGSKPVNTKLTIKYVFVKSRYVELREGENVIEVEIPDSEVLNLGQQKVIFHIDNYLPFTIIDVKLPNGTSLSKTISSIENSTLGIKIEPKNLELNCDTLPAGTYKIIIGYGEEYIMPSVFLVKGTQFLNASVSPHESLTITGTEFGIPKDWNLLSYVVAIYSIQPLVIGQEPESFTIEASRILPVTTYRTIIEVAGISYILPPFIKFVPAIGVYIIFDKIFKIVNSQKVPLVVTYMPIIYKSVGVWSRDYVEVYVKDSDVASGLWTALVAQLPENARIVKIVTPSGAVYSGWTSTEVLWGSVPRLISISPNGHEAYIAVSTLDVSEVGKYRIHIEWKPIIFKVMTKTGKPLSNVTLKAYVGDEYVGTFKTNKNGIAEVYVTKPLENSELVVHVYYQNVEVYEVHVRTLTTRPIIVEIGTYNVTVLFMGAMNQAIPNAKITLFRIGSGPTYTATTDDSGMAIFTDVLEGTYLVTAEYKGLKYSDAVKINTNNVVTIKSDILAEIGGFVLTTLHALIATAGIGGGLTAAALAFKFLKKERNKRKPDYEVLTI
ncbi:MAG: hypothetical protein B6V02_00425 [Thermoprotei archaeon ex4572_64]|nr:MAG: hypothetical protein B6V02_00425 [Thermoprotei archaeon ex4572_64]